MIFKINYLYYNIIKHNNNHNKKNKLVKNKIAIFIILTINYIWLIYIILITFC